MPDDDEFDPINIPPPASGFDEPARPLRRIGGDRPGSVPAMGGDVDPYGIPHPEPEMDPLDKIIEQYAPTTMAHTVAGRLRQLERAYPDIMSLGQNIVNLNGRVGAMEPALQHLSQQRALGEISLDRHTRGQALDLAIKAVPESHRNDPTMITTLAEAFIAWLKAGTQN